MQIMQMNQNNYPDKIKYANEQKYTKMQSHYNMNSFIVEFGYNMVQAWLPTPMLLYTLHCNLFITQ